MKIKLLTETSKLPVRATPGASCWDVFANEKFALLPGERCVVKLGFAVELWPGTEIQIRPRSGLALRDGILCHLGTIDSDYRGEVGAILFNLGQHTFRGEVGDRIAQMALCPVMTHEFQVVEELSETQRGTGGFGSTGVRAP